MSDTQSEAVKAMIIRVCAGDRDALGELYNLYGKLVYSIAYKTLQKKEDAEECTQDVFLAVWNHADTLADTPAKVLPWLIRTTRNRSIDRIRKVERRLPSSERIHLSPDERPPVEDTETRTAADELLAAERSEIVRNAIEKLPENQRLAISLAYFRGLSQSEIAKSQGESLGTIKSRIRYAMIRLRNELEGAHVS